MGLTRAGPGADPHDPESLYPTGVRNYVRVTPPDDLQGAAHAVLAKRLGLRNVYVVEDGDDYATALEETFRRAARRLGVEVAGTATWDARSPSSADLAVRIRRSGAEGVLVAGFIDHNGIQLVRDLRAGLAPDVVLMAGDGFPVFELLHEARRAAIGMYMTRLRPPSSS